MGLSVDTINAVMSLTAGLLALAAVIINLLPRDDAVASIKKLRDKAVDFAAPAFAIAAAIAVFFFGSQGLGLLFIFISALITSTLYLLSKHPATRGETFVLIIQITVVLAFMMLHFLTRIISILEKNL